MRGEIIGFFIVKQTEKPRLCSVVKHLEAIECFPFTSFVLYRFLRALQQNRGFGAVEASLFGNYHS